MNSAVKKKRCAIYTRKSSEEGLEQEFNSLHAQREACEAYVRSQHGEGWQLIKTTYDDGGFSGGNMERPSLSILLEDIRRKRIDTIIVYKVDRLSRSLADFARLIEIFDQNDISFVSVTQQFNTSTSMGRLTLNVLLSFAQFEREVTSERIRDKIAASKRRGMWMGGIVPLGYKAKNRKLLIDKKEATLIRAVFDRYLELGCVRRVKQTLDAEGVFVQPNTRRHEKGLRSFSRGALYNLLKNPVYVGRVRHKDKSFPGQHKAIISLQIWEAVQQRLESNRHTNRIKTRSKNPSLLSGLLFDDCGHRMSPSHSRKEGVHRRYYVSQAILLFKEDEAGSVARVPAHAIEKTLAETLKLHLTNPEKLLSLLGDQGLAPHDIENLIRAAQMNAKQWSQQTPSEEIEIVQKILRRVEVSRTSLRIEVLRSGLLSWLLPKAYPSGEPGNSDDSATISVPVRLQRRGIEKRLVIASGDDQPPPAPSVAAIQNALAKALQWNLLLVGGKVNSMKALAMREKITPRYVTRLLKLAWLAPDIIRAIQAGKLPAELTLDRLKKGFPLNWPDQRQVLGFYAQNLKADP